jgi:YbgC/YbaW family acyl-CoA thioester hydrolase
MAFVSTRKIRFDDVDGAGIVYYPQFFHLCHEAFEDLFDEIGPVSYPELIRDRRQGFPTVAIASNFLSPLAYGDVARVTLSVKKLGRTSVVMHYEIHEGRTGRKSFEADITQVLMDLDEKKALPLDAEFQAFLGNHLSEGMN